MPNADASESFSVAAKHLFRLVASAAAHELGRRRDAHRLIEEALPAAERFGSAPILRDAYDAAARVTGYSRFSRQAGEVSRVLTA